MKSPDVLCLGTVKLGIPDYGFSSNSTSVRFDPISFLKDAESIGINRFDTSPRYGQSEKILGQYIVQRGTTPFISSKIDNLRPRDPGTPGKMLVSVKSTLSKLNLTKLDICYLHQNDLDIISDPYIAEGFELLKKHDLMRYSGASLYSFEECEFAQESGLFDFIQIPVSVFDTSFYNRFVKTKSTSTRFVARSLLLQGILVNRNTISSRIRQSQQVLGYLKQLDQIAQECGLSTLELALAFVFSLNNIDHYLIGTTSKKSLESDVGCLKIELPSHVFNCVSEIASTQKSWTNPRNWERTI